MFAAALTAGLAGTMLASATPSSALPAPGESTFVPVVPCRLLDTRPDPAFNVGSRTTPLGPGETHQLAVTGAQGNCAVPDGASAVALNVTGVAPTAASYLTLFPFGADRPTSSNLNLVAGGAPTPNKVDVQLSADGELGLFNAFGEVHVIADVTGYYAADGLAELAAALAAKADAADVYTQAQVDAALAGLAALADVYTQAQVDAALLGKADSDAVYTQAEVDALLADKADSADVYTQAEVEARTQMRSISLPITALNLPDHVAFDATSGELWWSEDTTASARLAIARPEDWTGDSPVTVRILFTRTPNLGNVLFRLTVRAFDAGIPTNGPAEFVDPPPQSDEDANVAREAVAEIPAGALAGAWWDIGINRRNGDYNDPVFVRSIEIEYEATT